MFEAKIATCCYCGRRTRLQNTAHDGHELACGSCGAPVHMMKPLQPAKASAAASHAPAKTPKPLKGRKHKKKKKSFWRKVASEIFDEIEDIFD